VISFDTVLQCHLNYLLIMIYYYDILNNIAVKNNKIGKFFKLITSTHVKVNSSTHDCSNAQNLNDKYSKRWSDLFRIAGRIMK
jgi:hypothetical protein